MKDELVEIQTYSVKKDAKGNLISSRLRKRERVITIEIRSGALIDVRGLPRNWSYRLIDHDLESDGEVEE